MSRSASTEELLPVTAPPPYHEQTVSNKSASEDRMATDLRESFAALLEEQTNVQRLFSTVASRLEHTNRIGKGHALWMEWEELREVREPKISQHVPPF
jgi:hypothetical protein